MRILCKYFRDHLLVLLLVDDNGQSSYSIYTYLPSSSKYKTHDRISALDDAHARIAPYAHRVILDNQRDLLLEFEAICQDVKCQPVPTRIYRVDAHAMHFFREDSESMIQVSR
jgi:hypothetical protein